MDKTWSLDDLHRLETLVQGLLSRPLTTQDLPHLRYVLAEQAAVLDRAYRLLGRQAELIAGLTEEVETLRRLVEDDGDGAWDEPDDRPW